jgi:hypothetical protein
MLEYRRDDLNRCFSLAAAAISSSGATQAAFRKSHDEGSGKNTRRTTRAARRA